MIFQKESVLIKPALGDHLLNIYHIGSTAVPRLAAKPKIDIIAEVNTLEFEDKDLQCLGYTYRGGFNIPLCKSYSKKTKGLNINLHIFEQNDPKIELNLKFRDYLCNNQDAKNKYEALKYKSILKEATHLKNGFMYVGYTLGKNDLIQQILKEIGFNRLRLLICTHYSDWVSAKYFRQKYFFDKVHIADPYEWTFDHQDHKNI